MASPLLPDLSAAPLQAMSRASMRHRVTLSEPQSRDAGHGAETEELDPIVTGPFPCLLRPASTETVERAGARGAAAEWTLRLPLGTAVRPGMTGTVTGQIGGTAWSVGIEITGVDFPNRLMTLCTAVDRTLNSERDVTP